MPTLSPTRGRLQRLALGAVICGFVAIVLGPPLATYFPMELAKWYLAAAQHALDSADKPGDEQIQEAERLLHRAVKLDPSIESTADYLRLRLTIRPEEIWPALIAGLQNLGPERRKAEVLSHATLRARLGEFEAARRLIAAVYPSPEDRDAELNNLFAYMAAESNTDLKEAERSIELAIKEQPNSALLDTKAWVLHRQGRFDEALPVMQRAIRERYREISEELDKASNTPLAKKLLARLERIRGDDVLSGYPPETLLELLLQGEMRAGESEPSEPADEPADPKAEASEDVAAASGPTPDRDSAGESVDASDDPEAAELPSTVAEVTSRLENKIAPLPEVPGVDDQADLLFGDFAVFRYHRAEIIRELGHPAIAALEYEYLRANGIEDPSQLH